MEFDLADLTPDVRHLDDMREVLCNKNLSTTENPALYYMYRGVEKNGELRYDITVIPAKMLGEEFVKTKGHYHLENWQEVYTVLEGNAIYLMQRIGANSEIEDAYFVKAEKGDSIIIPPKYGHVTINPSETKELKMANWVSENCKVDYLPYENSQGACYYYILQPGSGQATWVKNENYKNVPELRFEKPLKSVPEDLSFLK